MAEVNNSQFRGDMLDIIFANRNKAYGAYNLRRSYPKYLMRALGLGLVVIALFMAMPYILSAISNVLTQVEKPIDAEIVMEAPPDVDKNEPPPPPPPPPPTPPPPVKASVAFVPPVVLPDEKVVEEEPRKEIEQLDTMKTAIGKKDNEGEDNPDPNAVSGDGLDPVTPVVTQAKNDDPVELTDVQKLPSFPGGDSELMKYLAENIKYPAIAKENNIQGTVALSFVVEKNGSLSNIKILKDPGGGCGKEAQRVLESMPRWTPGEANGNPVRVKFTLPVRFRLEG
jgi:periplasmic protein TonB